MSMCNIKECLRGLCVEKFGNMPDRVASLPQAGGDRKYFRMFMPGSSAPSSLLGVEADDKRDARSFVELAGIFASNGVNVPMVYAHSADYSCYIEEDLGDVSLFSMLGSQQAGEFVRSSLAALVKMQVLSESEWLDAVAYPEFSRRQILWDLNYFKYEYLKNSTVTFDEDALEDDFERFAERLLSLPHEFWGFMMRDCQSRNVMMCGDKPYFIDFQGGRLGPCLYDAVSFLWQAKAGFDPDFRNEMIDFYIDEFVSSCHKLQCGGIVAEEAESIMRAALPDFVLFRTLQVLGAYGFRGLVQKRAHFIESIPGALANLSQLAADGVLDSYAELKRVCCELAIDARFNAAADDRLHVKVFSFSYKRGYPDDFSGNGGGFMFDCRGMHNPGRYDEYKQLTGLDRPVIDFLKHRGEIDGFVDKAVDLVSPTVSRYIDRGFSQLQIGFGCTGGRHRSVYSAQAVAEKLAALYPDAVVELCHREQGISDIFNDN